MKCAEVAKVAKRLAIGSEVNAAERKNRVNQTDCGPPSSARVGPSQPDWCCECDGRIVPAMSFDDIEMSPGE
jgi:hypothetical protein